MPSGPEASRLQGQVAQALAKVGPLALRARAIVEGALAGLHRSPHHGASVEFAEHKEYSPGDEIRHIDWKAYGKLDRYYVKRFELETEMTAYLVLDASGSMGYRGGERGDGPSKLEVAGSLLAALAYLLMRQNDRPGLLAFGGGGNGTYVPPRARASHLADLFGAIERTVATGGRGPTALAPALDRLAELARTRRSLIVLASDLFDRSPEVPGLLRRLRARGHDVTVFQVLDPDELEFPFRGVTRFVSMEDDRHMIADPQAVRAAYLAELGRFLAGVTRSLREGNVEHRLVTTARPLEQTLLDFLTARHT